MCWTPAVPEPGVVVLAGASGGGGGCGAADNDDDYDDDMMTMASIGPMRRGERKREKEGRRRGERSVDRFAHSSSPDPATEADELLQARAGQRLVEVSHLRCQKPFLEYTQLVFKRFPNSIKTRDHSTAATTSYYCYYSY